MSIITGDCLEQMRLMEPNSISAIVTDPPYGLHFMGKGWDHFNHSKIPIKNCHKKLASGDFEFRDRNVPQIDTANAYAGTYDKRRNDEFQIFIEQFGVEALRVLKPSGHILMFGAPRRYHRQVSGLEDSGFEIRDCLMWIYGSGFPKSHNKFGIEGYGTALKPAYEPIIMAMKPCDGTFKQNAEKWGQAGINIDGCRVGTEERSYRGAGISSLRYSDSRAGSRDGRGKDMSFTTNGRWPANVIFDEEAAQMLDEQSGVLKSGSSCKRRNVHKSNSLSSLGTLDSEEVSYGDSGGASRFFYCAKASSSERNEGLERFPLKENSGQFGHKRIDGRNVPIQGGSQQNNHPTVKPLKLMEYLIKLIMPPKDGILLDPFAGSGTTILAAKRLGFNAIGIEKSQEYSEIARARINAFKKE